MEKFPELLYYINTIIYKESLIFYCNPIISILNKQQFGHSRVVEVGQLILEVIEVIGHLMCQEI